MRHALSRAGLAVAGLLGLIVAARVAAVPLVDVTIPPAAGSPPAVASGAARGHPDSVATRLVRRNPFRTTRRPAPVAYHPVALSGPPAPEPPKPALVLAGIVWDGGDDPTAVVEGLPGAAEPRIVRRGDVVGGLRVAAIARDRVTVSGMDTVWVLRLKEPWR
jgi:hypothetical protein